MLKPSFNPARYLAATAAIAAVTWVFFRILPANVTTVSLAMLLLVLAAATSAGLAEAIFTSILAVFAINYFFLPPIGTFTISDPENWVALFVFFATAFTVSQLSSRSLRRAAEATAGRAEVTQLYELSRAMLMEDTHDAVRHSVLRTGQILNLTHIAFFDLSTAAIYGSLEGSAIPPADLGSVARGADAIVVTLNDADSTAVIPVHLGTRIIGSLAMQGPPMNPALRDSVASLLAFNYERVRAMNSTAAADLAKRNEEFKSSLLDGLAHDLKTPLTAIRTCVTTLIDLPPRTEEVRQELLSIIDQESVRLQQTITEAIQLARIESRELRVTRELGMAANLFASLPNDPVVDVDPGLVLAVDPGLFRRALLQILENARKYAPPDSPIEISAHNEDGHTLISISDHGPGFRPDELDKIFGKYYRGRAVTASVEGTGMGLAIARAIVEAHGGAIKAANRPGGGATILIAIPATSLTPQ